MYVVMKWHEAWNAGPGVFLSKKENRTLPLMAGCTSTGRVSS
jgi:hypothetical protein